MDKASIVGRESEETGPNDVGRLAASLRYSIKWLQAITFTQNMALLMWSGQVVTVKQCGILGIHYGIIELYPTSKGLSDMKETEHAYLVARGCENLKNEGEGEYTIEDGTIQKYSLKKRHSTEMLPSPAYFESDHRREDRLGEVTISEIQE